MKSTVLPVVEFSESSSDKITCIISQEILIIYIYFFYNNNCVILLMQIYILIMTDGTDDRHKS